MLSTKNPSGPLKPQDRDIEFCKTCQRETPHQVHSGDGASIKLCMACVERTLMCEHDRC